ncbi:MAG: hypothetical protein COV36_05430 [Alphaproteobacteria bacterium CG11_big_fil_rev_8_21_14_0_20_44_7]|nr:MAG: hypothetical protein COV36_05430 [Alphaproteobacteria bacterium CG11_big_fil_rev_8_21_14_0_20_44_7]
MKQEIIERIAAELWLEVEKFEKPAARIINKFVRDKRINSKKARAISDIIFTKLREMPLPEWYVAYLPADFTEELAALNEAAPTDLRVNTLKLSREEGLQLLQEMGCEAEATPLSKTGIRLAKKISLKKDGKFEVQDEGSQLLAEFCGAQAGEKILDFCAGQGGKSLALAALMENDGEIVAYDKFPERMTNFKKRANLAGAEIIKICDKLPDEEFDLVLVDSPCSGSGTWRRDPSRKFSLSEDELNSLVKTQQEILSQAAKYVKKGGRMIYATCSLLPIENIQQIEWFMSQSEIFDLSGDLLELSPRKTNTDGFFAARLIKN